MHHDYSEPTLARLRTGGIVLVNSTVFEGSFDRASYITVDVPATDLAVDVGNLMTASMVMIGAYAAVTGLVAPQSLERAVVDALPPYRAQHAELNARAPHAGYDAVPGAGRRRVGRDAR